MGNAFLYRMPAGIVGQINRASAATVEAQIMDSGTPVTGFGLPVKIVSEKVQPIGAGSVGTDVYGFLARPYPTQTTQNEALGTATPATSGICDVLLRGYMSVKLNGATAAAKKGTAYVRVANAASGKPIGGIEAAADVSVAGGTITGTGTGTIAATVSASAIPGTWGLTLQTTSQTSKVTVIDPNGLRHPDATVGTAYTSGGLTFTITAAGTMTAGDSFAPVVTASTVAMPGVTFTGPADANGITEIAVHI